MPRNTSGLKHGGPGRPKGTRNKVPGNVKASLKRVFEEVASTDPALIRRAVLAGVRAKPPKSFPYVQLLAHYLDGKPADTVKVQGRVTGPPIVVIP